MPRGRGPRPGPVAEAPGRGPGPEPEAGARGPAPKARDRGVKGQIEETQRPEGPDRERYNAHVHVLTY